MKVLTCTSLLLSYLAVSVTAADAQSLVLDFKGFNTITSAAYSKLRTVPYRSKYSVVTKDKKVSSWTLTVSEHLPSGEYRSIETDSDNSRTERVYVNRRRYLKLNDNKWIEETRGNGSGSGGRSGTPLITARYEYKGKETVSQTLTNLYESNRRLIFKGDKADTESVVRSRYWIREDGLLVRVEITTNTNEPRQSRVSTWDFEYDSNIKILAPID